MIASCETGPGGLACRTGHPNEFDLRRIRRALDQRKRYRYVSPRVWAEPGGYRIESPCCSRNIDPAGGVIDVARLAHVGGGRPWQLYQPDERAGGWRLNSVHQNLNDALDLLAVDEHREFWR